MILSRISSQAQTTLPQPVRLALGVGDGDTLAYEIKGRSVVVTKATAPAEDPFAVFSEWPSQEDGEAFADL